jgi:hypothetical protein
MLVQQPFKAIYQAFPSGYQEVPETKKARHSRRAEK